MKASELVELLTAGIRKAGDSEVHIENRYGFHVNIKLDIEESSCFTILPATEREDKFGEPA